MRTKRNKDVQKTNELVESTIARLDNMLNEVTRDIEQRQQKMEAAIWRNIEEESISKDSEDWKQLLHEAQRARKLSAISTLTGGLAHDFNNLLSIIIGYTSLARTESINGHDVDYYLTKIENCAFSAADLSNELLAISYEAPPHKINLSITNTIAHAAYEALLTFDTECILQVDEDLWPVEGDATQLRQAFAALIVNGAQAMDGRGQVTISGENVTVDENSSLHLAPGKYVHLTFEDIGKGIAKEHLTCVFDPYFTTDSKAHGLGLTAAKSIIRRHEGLIELQSRLGAGTEQHVYLPAVSEPLVMVSFNRAIAVTPSAESVGKGRVLVMEDSPTLLEMTTEMLSAIGWEVQGAPDGETTLTLYEEAKKKRKSFPSRHFGFDDSQRYGRTRNHQAPC